MESKNLIDKNFNIDSNSIFAPFDIVDNADCNAVSKYIRHIKKIVMGEEYDYKRYPYYDTLPHPKREKNVNDAMDKQFCKDKMKIIVSDVPNVPVSDTKKSFFSRFMQKKTQYPDFYNSTFKIKSNDAQLEKLKVFGFTVENSIFIQNLYNGLIDYHNKLLDHLDRNKRERQEAEKKKKEAVRKEAERQEAERQEAERKEAERKKKEAEEAEKKKKEAEKKKKEEEAERKKEAEEAERKKKEEEAERKEAEIMQEADMNMALEKAQIKKYHYNVFIDFDIDTQFQLFDTESTTYNDIVKQFFVLYPDKSIEGIYNNTTYENQEIGTPPQNLSDKLSNSVLILTKPPNNDNAYNMYNLFKNDVDLNYTFANHKAFLDYTHNKEEKKFTEITRQRIPILTGKIIKTENDYKQYMRTRPKDVLCLDNEVCIITTNDAKIYNSDLKPDFYKIAVHAREYNPWIRLSDGKIMKDTENKFPEKENKKALNKQALNEEGWKPAPKDTNLEPSPNTSLKPSPNTSLKPSPNTNLEPSPRFIERKSLQLKPNVNTLTPALNQAQTPAPNTPNKSITQMFFTEKLQRKPDLKGSIVVKTRNAKQKPDEIRGGKKRNTMKKHRKKSKKNKKSK